MNAKYQLKRPEVEMIQYKEICIGCGKYRQCERVSFMPTPNRTDRPKPPSRLKCMLGNHVFYPEDKVERISK